MKIQIRLLALLFLLTSSFACTKTDANKCISIDSPSERLKCFDSMYSKNKEQENIKVEKASQKNQTSLEKLNNFIEKILNIPMQKGEFETTKEFNARIINLYKKYDGNVYEIDLNINDYNSGRFKIASYNPDTELITLSMPQLDFVTVGLQVNDKSDDERITLSFLETKSLEQVFSNYTARNGIGNEVEVVKATFRDIGLAILGKSNRDMDGQSFKLIIPREKARSIIQHGKVKITVKVNLIKKGENSFMLDNWMTWASKGASILISEKNERKPTMSDPAHVVREKSMLPVRLITIQLIDERGKEVFKAEGTQKTTSYFSE